MKAMVLHEPRLAEDRPLRLDQVKVPIPGPGQVRVAVQYCGLCHTDLHEVEGDLKLPRLPVIPGHQVVGVVESVGPRVRNVREGDRVGIPWLHWTCGKCVYCRAGQENLCENAQFTGFHQDGGYAEFTVVDQKFAFPLPAGFPDHNAAPLLCAGVIGYRALKLSGAKKGSCLGLFGFGASAHLVLQMALHRGSQVFVFTRTASHQDLARQMGASWAGSPDDFAPEAMDEAIIFAPAGELVPQALRRVRKGGVVTLAGITMSTVPEMDYSLLYFERVLRSVANSTREDVRDCLQLAGEIPLRTEVEVLPLEKANEALLALKQSRIRAAGVLKISG
ncbi:MAG TPA: zinc-dependent alcohol dehydrogenase family protein [Terriglobales bacterium]|nr:zinc-dependent alcohol dehydrogenase family protein [Terriglobales bacterium]